VPIETSKTTSHGVGTASIARWIRSRSMRILISLSLAAVLPATADSPGRGLNRELKISYLRFLIDNHFSELHMTELAARTQLTAPIPEIVPDAQTFPSPGYPPTGAKASLAAWWIPAPIAHLEFFARY
ncbi:MAG TPA: hypothetical protein VHJ19_08825, partial [Gammaproteobacteria bacterium]|nr:hypothetical protein [Gammaproteobacteria bacterium]